MDNQTSLFDVPFTKIGTTAKNYYYTECSSASVHTAFADTGTVVVTAPEAKGNDKSDEKPEHYSGKGLSKTVYPFKSDALIGKMGRWLYDNSQPKYFLAYVLGINLGLRANELLALRWSDILAPDDSFKYDDDPTDTSDKIDVYQKKTDKHRGLWLNEACVKALRWYMAVNRRWKDSDYIFASRKGDGPIQVSTLRHELKKAAVECHVKQNIGTHSLRKTFGYAHFKANHDIVFLQRLFGHSSALTTMRYIGIADEDEKRAYRDGSIDVLGMI